VYVESNFILEIALQQEEAAQANELLDMVEGKLIELAFPAFSLSEPFATVVARAKARAGLAETTRQQMRELGRSQPHRSFATSLESLTKQFAAIAKAEMDLLESTLGRMLRAARVLPLDATTFASALAHERTLGLSAPDAIILASVESDLRTVPSQPRCFLNRNHKDFGQPGVRAVLDALECRYMPAFAQGLAFVRSQLPKEP
jgi:predicted nucleic acid-binding protein